MNQRKQSKIIIDSKIDSIIQVFYSWQLQLKRSRFGSSTKNFSTKDSNTLLLLSSTDNALMWYTYKVQQYINTRKIKMKYLKNYLHLTNTTKNT